MRRAAHVLSRMLGEIVLAGVLGAALVFTWSDGTPTNDNVDLVAPAPTFSASVAGYADPVHVRVPIASPDPPPEPPVPSAPPAMILIPSLNVHRPVEAVGLDRSGTMEITQNLWNAGWYKGGPVPSAPGDAVIEGHAGYPDAPLLFGRLRQLHSGDKIVVVLSDGTRRLFLVDSLAIWPAGTSPPGMGEPYGPPRLTLITCTGPFDDHYKTYADRLAVEATYAGLA
ncbi:MAG: class F sortase [Chloroflexi bacterium]|nr:MAG: class F sortase [Chloroflexota bacterium]